jgi:hypothetical protein
MDERIRENARQALATEVAKALEPLYDKMRGRSHTLVAAPYGGEKKDEYRFDVWNQLRETQENLVALLAPAAGEAAVAEFIAKVESLQEQIDSLSIQQ